LPEAHSQRPSVGAILLTIFGVGFIFLVSRVI